MGREMLEQHDESIESQFVQQESEQALADTRDAQAQTSINVLYAKSKEMRYANSPTTEKEKLELTQELENSAPVNYIEHYRKEVAISNVESAGAGMVRDHSYHLAYQDKLYNGACLLEMSIADEAVSLVASGAVKGVVRQGEIVELFEDSTNNNFYKYHNQLLAERCEESEQMDERVTKFALGKSFGLPMAYTIAELRQQLLALVQESKKLVYFDLTKVLDGTPKELLRIMDAHNSRLLAERAMKDGKDLTGANKTSDKKVREGISDNPMVAEAFLDIKLKKSIEGAMGFHWDNVSIEGQIAFLKTLFENRPDNIALLESISHTPEYSASTRFAIISTILRIKSEKVKEKFLATVNQPPEMAFEEDPLSGGVHAFRPSDYSELIASLCTHFKYILDQKDKAVEFASQVTKSVAISEEYFNAYFTERLEYRLEKYLEKFEPGWQSAPRWDELQKDFTVETESYLAVIKTLHEQGDKNPLEKIKDFSISRGLEEGGVDKLWSIYEANWAPKTTPEYLQQLKDKFYNRVTQEGARFSVLTYQKEPVGFYGFTDNFTGLQGVGVYAGAFNMDEKFQRSKVGEIFLSIGLEEERKKGLPIYAETNPNNPMLKKYMEMGFEVYGQRSIGGEEEVLLVIPANKMSATQ